jgi:aspartokinase/homoserine dehydrogenase 1
MKVLKFGGSSLADAERYLRVKDISIACHNDVGAAVVLSAPKGVTNALSLLCDEAAAGKDYGELFAKLNMVLFGILDDLKINLPNFSQAKLADYIQHTLNDLNQHLEGFALLRCAPEQVVARVLSVGEYVSVNIFSEILTSLGHANSIIDPVDYIVAEGDYLDSIADVSASKARFSDVDISGQKILIMPGFVAVKKSH